MAGDEFPPFVETDGDWNTVCQALYQHFSEVFKCKPRRKIQDKPLVFDGRCEEDGLEEGFWHLITAGKKEDRRFDPNRARRICWIGPMLDGVLPGISRWMTDEGNGTRKIYYWLEEQDYVLILHDKPKVVVLITAFYVDRHWLREDLTKRRENGETF